jgi:hypothetical protein
MKNELKAGERVYNVIRGKAVDRLPVIEWVPWWNLTVERWRREGLQSDGILDIQRHFGLDGCVPTRFHPETQATPVAQGHGLGILKTDAEYEKIRKTMFRNPAECCPKERLAQLKKWRAEGDVALWFEVDGFFWHTRDLFGIEAHLYSFYDEPELYNRICRDHADWLKKVIEFAGNEFKFDYMTFAEDMSYNNGPMLSKELFDEFLAPYYREIIPLIKQSGTLTVVDSDGDITQATGWFGDCGMDGMLPLERQAGVDVSLYLDQHPEMFFLGHFDKMVMHQGRAALEKEFARLLPSAARGRFIPSVDHQTPPAVSYADYKLYVSLLKQFAVDAARR